MTISKKPMPPQEATVRFFTAAAVQVNEGVRDPADLCGEIQPDLDRTGLSEALAEARDIAERACTAAAEGDTDQALRLWQEIFGEDFPGSCRPGQGRQADHRARAHHPA